VRAYLQGPAATDPGLQWDGRLPAGATLTVSKFLYGATSPTLSAVAVPPAGAGAGGSCVERSLAEYFARSDQAPTRVALGPVGLLPSGGVARCTGALLQRLPPTGGRGPGAGGTRFEDAGGGAGGAWAAPGVDLAAAAGGPAAGAWPLRARRRPAGCP
jgi:hypothetical protein